MKVKIIGFKVGKARPVFNRTIDINDINMCELGELLYTALDRSDFLSIRWVQESEE